jgi:hypothetical protein
MRKKIRAGADRKQRRREFRLLGSFRIRRAGGESGIKERIFQRERPQEKQGCHRENAGLAGNRKNGRIRTQTGGTLFYFRRAVGRPRKTRR